MKFVRYNFANSVHYGILDNDVVREINAPPYEAFKNTGVEHPLSGIQVLAPVLPSKLVAIALNYPTHLSDRPAPTRPEPFLKTPSSLIGPGDQIVLPRDAGRIDEEAELVAVIGKTCRNVAPEDALEYVLGYTCGGDISAREWQANDKQWWRAKSSDTFSPLGPIIDTDVNGPNTMLVARLNGKEVQRSSTSEMLFNVPILISAISLSMTLEPGDVVYTGTPGITAELSDGDELEVEIEGIGILANPVRLGP